MSDKKIFDKNYARQKQFGQETLGKICTTKELGKNYSQKIFDKNMFDH